MTNQGMFADPLGVGLLLAVAAVFGVLVWGVSGLFLKHRRVRVPLGVIVIAVGGALAYDVLRTSSGFLAGIVWQQALLMMLLVAAISVALVVIPRTRRRGLVGLCAAVAMIGGFFCVYLGGYYLGLHAWANDVPVPLR